MKKNNTTTRPEGQTKYYVTKDTAAILDALHEVALAHTAVIEAVCARYGDDVIDGVDILDVKVEPYREHLRAVAQMLEAELNTAINEHIDEAPADALAITI